MNENSDITMKYCPKCSAATLTVCEYGNKNYSCSTCQFTFYQNVASAVMVAICCGDEILVATRARAPGKGMWDLPGGFVDPDESLEQAVKRELYEELGLVVEKSCYLGSNPNTYPYKGIVYKTCDCFFLVELQDKPDLVAQDDVASIEWIKREELELERFAFESAKRALHMLKDEY